MLQVAAMASPDMMTIDVLRVVVLVVLQVKPRLEVIKAFRTKVAPSWNYHCFLPKHAHRRAARFGVPSSSICTMCAHCAKAPRASCKLKLVTITMICCILLWTCMWRYLLCTCMWVLFIV